MPPPLDKIINISDSLPDPSPSFSKETPGKRSSGRKGQGKSSKKHGPDEDIEDKDKGGISLPEDLTLPSSILSQAPKATSSPTIQSNGIPPSLLEAWTPKPISRPPAHSPTRTTESADGAAYGRSLNTSNVSSLAGSPPRNHRPSEARRSLSNHASPPISPRSAHRLPVPRDSEYQSFGDRLGSSPSSNRTPRSIHPPTSPYAPLPHHPQAHFYDTPDIDLGMPTQGSTPRPLIKGFCCSFDTLPSVKYGAETENILLVGYERFLEIFHVEENRFVRIGRLEGLRGSVIGIKVISSQTSVDHRQLPDPMVAVIVHGPCVPLSTDSVVYTGETEKDEFQPSDSMIHALRTVVRTQYQTTVEVYRLVTGKYVTTLFESPRVDMDVERYSKQTCTPPPVGNLKVHSTGEFIIISSGTSGEVFVFEDTHTLDAEEYPAFRCIGKTWTRTRPTEKTDPPRSLSESGSMAFHDEMYESHLVEDAIISSSPRWLAFLPPTSSAQISMHGKVMPGYAGRKIPGVSTHTSPSQPQVNCTVNTSDEESFLNKVARDAAQEFMKGAKWLGSQGLQALTNYWKPSDQNQGESAGSSRQNGSTAAMVQSAFPPTHGQERPPGRVKNETTLIAILDLKRLSQSQHLKEIVALQPLAAFSCQNGCSLLSFSPSGLNLLTASTKGDVQQIWDLKRMVHGETGHVGDGEVAVKAPSVREVARFTRVTEARIVDVVWKGPKGEKIVIITDRGTAHIYDLPSSAFQWPPPRQPSQGKGQTVSQATEFDHDGQSETARTKERMIHPALGLLSGNAQPFFATVRGVSPRVGSVVPSLGVLHASAGAHAKSSKTVAAGLNRSFSAAASGTVNKIRHLGENRFSLPASSNMAATGRVQWLDGRNSSSLAVTGGGLLRIHAVRQNSNARNGRRRPSVHNGRPIEFKITLQDAHGPHNVQGGTSSSSGSFWQPTTSRPMPRNAQEPNPLSYAELETHAPYQPFHTDRRIRFLMYGNDDEPEDRHRHSPDDWLFGESVPTTKISSGSEFPSEDIPHGSQTRPVQLENIISMEDTKEGGKEMLITTRRRRRKKGEGTGVDEGEFFEDDCEVVDFADERI